jgi:anti-anti-sigma factor
MVTDWFAVSSDGKVQVLALLVPPHLDGTDVDKLHEAVLNAISTKAGERWVIDLSATAFMGSSMLGLMVNLRQRIRGSGGKVVLCGLNPKLLQVFRTCSLERLFSIRAARAEAVAEVANA